MAENLEAIYYSKPVPVDLATLNILGVVFDKIHFPGVYIPASGFNQTSLDAEIQRLINLPPPHRDRDSLIGVLKFVRFAKDVSSFCIFEQSHEKAFTADSAPNELLKQLHEALHGPTPPGLHLMFEGSHSKALPGGNEAIAYPATYNYQVRAFLRAERDKIPLVNSYPKLPVPGCEPQPPVDDARTLSTVLAIEATKAILPGLPLLHPADLAEFRDKHQTHLKSFRRSMLAYAADLNAQIADMNIDEFERRTKFYIEAKILPSLSELSEALNSPSRSWYERAIDGLSIVPQITGSYYLLGPKGAAVSMVLKAASTFYKELMASGVAHQKIKSNGLYYLLRYKQSRS